MLFVQYLSSLCFCHNIIFPLRGDRKHEGETVRDYRRLSAQTDIKRIIYRSYIQENSTTHKNDETSLTYSTWTKCKALNKNVGFWKKKKEEILWRKINRKYLWFFSNNSLNYFGLLFFFVKNLLFLVSLCNSRFHEQMNVVCTNKQMVWNCYKILFFKSGFQSLYKYLLIFIKYKNKTKNLGFTI